jgi:hypothetical protein
VRFSDNESADALDAKSAPYRTAHATTGPAGSFIEWKRTAERVC